MGNVLVIDRYLNRIGLPQGPERETSREWLGELQVAHMIHVPFENLDVFHRRGVTTDLDHSLDKVVTRRRGGWCFELNGAFGWLLGELGFDVSYVSCRVFGDEGWGPDLDHCGLIVTLDDVPTYVDVGFGDNCMVPIPLVAGQHDGVPRQVSCEIDSDSFVLSELQLDGQWAKQLWGSFEPLPLTAFNQRCHYLQTEPGLAWSEKPFATRATDPSGSRVTLRRQVLKTRFGRSEFDDTTIDSEDWSPLLLTHFGLQD